MHFTPRQSHPDLPEPLGSFSRFLHDADVGFQVYRDESAISFGLTLRDSTALVVATAYPEILRLRSPLTRTSQRRTRRALAELLLRVNAHLYHIQWQLDYETGLLACQNCVEVRQGELDRDACQIALVRIRHCHELMQPILHAIAGSTISPRVATDRFLAGIERVRRAVPTGACGLESPRHVDPNRN